MTKKLTSTAVLLGVLATSSVAFGAESIEGKFKMNLSDEVRAELQACRDNDDQRGCMAAVLEANDLEMPMHKRGHSKKKGMLRLTADLSDEAKAELQACRDNDDQRGCMAAVLEANGVEKPERPERANRPEVSGEVRTELKACRTNNLDDREAGKACAEEVFEANGLEMPEHTPHGRRGRRNRGSFARSNGQE